MALTKIEDDSRESGDHSPKITHNIEHLKSSTVASRFFDVQIWLSRQLKSLTFHDPVHLVYDPLEYAEGMYFQFVQHFCLTPKAVLILGMNPGPWGMAQTGIPFGEVDTVKTYLSLEEYGSLIYKPELEHPSRKIVGLQCHRKELSGLKLWNLIKALTNSRPAAEALKNIFLHNFCPLLFLKQSGCNLTPDELKAGNCKKELFDLCSEALVRSITVLECKHVLCIGKFAEKQAIKALSRHNSYIKVSSIPHPSPRNVTGRKNWEQNSFNTIISLGLLPFFRDETPVSSGHRDDPRGGTT